MEQFFEAEILEFTKHKRGQSEIIKSVVVYCKNLKTGIDGGGGFLKVCLNIFSKNNISSGEKLKDSGVKKLLLIGIAPQIDENYDNVKKIIMKIGLNSNISTVVGIPKLSFASDLKLINIALGLMGHSSNHPCPYCDASRKELINEEIARTLGDIRQSYLNWTKARQKQKDSKNFKNCTNDTIFEFSDSMLNVFPPPELHLLLGIVNLFYETLEKVCGAEISEGWARSCNVQRDVLFGGSFNGNSCNKLLKSVSFLCENIPLTHRFLCSLINSFSKVVETCFGTELKANAIEALSEFKRLFAIASEKYKIPVTSKIHIIINHVQNFCAAQNAGLGIFSEQASESVHADFKTFWNPRG